ncbi:hypothetical protein Tco_1448742 [Tanacetum coccineum]
MSFSKRPGNDAVCYTKPLDSLNNWNDRFFWVDSFACPASKGVLKDPFPKSFEFNAEHYAILVAHPAPFHKYPKPFLCLVGIIRHYTLDVDTYPEFLRDGDEDGLAAGIEHGAHGRSLVDLVAYNPSAEEDYNAALQELRSLDFSLLAELKSHKDASVETIMNLLRLESPLVDAPGMSDLQPDVDQLMVPIHRSEDQAGSTFQTSLLFASGVSSRYRVEADQEKYFGASVFTDRSPFRLYQRMIMKIVHTDGQEGTDADGQTSTGADANPFPSTDDAELNVPE